MSELIKKAAHETGFDHVVPILLGLYSEPQRKYHNVEHIENLIGYALNSRYLFSDPIMVAILFHDAVYYPVSQYNEELSADLYWSRKPVMHETTHYDIFEAILATKDHTAPANDNFRHWIKDFLDFDLAGLSGASYRDNGVKIWHEYKPFFTKIQFVLGRMKFLEKMLAAPKIYWNHPEWEEAARRNMAEELTELGRGEYKFMSGDAAR